jgi:peptidyl-prolyl cis-trans isomerase SurA
MNSKYTNHRLSAMLALTGACLLLLGAPPRAAAQSIVVMVNDEPVTSYDIAQRQRFLALSSNLGDRMKKRMQSEETKQAFQNYMRENKPSSREEAAALQEKFIAKMQQNVIANAGSSMRQKAIEELIDEKLMLQAAREQKIQVTDADVDQFLTRMAQSGGKKRTLKEFLADFKAQGVNPETLKDRIRAQSAWRDVVRRVYGSRVRASAPSSLPIHDASGTILDVEIVRLAVGGNGDQKAAAQKLIEAEALRQKFQSCDQLKTQVKSVSGATIQSLKQVNIKDFRGDVQAALQQAKAGDITPPLVKGKSIELHAVCAKKVVEPPKDASATANADQDRTQEQFQLYSKRHLQDLKTRALLKYPKSG